MRAETIHAARIEARYQAAYVEILQSLDVGLWPLVTWWLCKPEGVQ